MDACPRLEQWRQEPFPLLLSPSLFRVHGIYLWLAPSTLYAWIWGKEKKKRGGRGGLFIYLFFN